MALNSEILVVGLFSGRSVDAGAPESLFNRSMAKHLFLVRSELDFVEIPLYIAGPLGNFAHRNQSLLSTFGKRILRSLVRSRPLYSFGLMSHALPSVRDKESNDDHLFSSLLRTVSSDRHCGPVSNRVRLPGTPYKTRLP